MPKNFKIDRLVTKLTLFLELKLRLQDAIYRLQFYSNSLIHILSFSNSHNNVASIQKNRDDKSQSNRNSAVQNQISSANMRNAV